MSQEQEQPAPASQSDQLSPAFDPRTFKRRFRNHLKRFRNHCDSKSPCELLRGGLETTAAVSLNSHLSYMFLYQGLKYKKGCEVSIPRSKMEDWGIDFGLENNEEDDVTKEIYHVTALVVQYTAKQLCKVPRRTSEQTGHAWVQEILQGHPIRCYEMFRMEKNIFHMLCTELVESGLKVTTRMGIEEMVAMFLNIIGHAQGNRMIQERFQHSGETVSRHLHKEVTMTNPATKRLMKDLEKLLQEPPAGISAEPQKNNILHWDAIIQGPKKSPWEGGSFKLTLQFPEDYPNKPPTGRFISPMFHPNIDAKDGRIFIDILRDEWRPIYNVESVLISIQSLLCDPNPNSPANEEAAKLFIENKREYNKRIRKLVEQSWAKDD
ncbi:hypothetical protein V6N13_029366 [Hibiscus sabdariffa]